MAEDKSSDSPAARSPEQPKPTDLTSRSPATGAIAGGGAPVQKSKPAARADSTVTDREQPQSLRDADATAFQPMEGAPVQQGTPTAGLSQSPGLRELPDSQVPGLAGGGMVSHVFGPGQSPVDPIAAGLDVGYNPLTRAENRMITQTGTLGAGARPSTYAHIGAEPVPQAGPSDHSNVPAISDEEAGRAPGPNSTGGDAPTISPHE